MAGVFTSGVVIGVNSVITSIVVTGVNSVITSIVVICVKCYYQHSCHRCNQNNNRCKKWYCMYKLCCCMYRWCSCVQIGIGECSVSCTDGVVVYK